MAKRVSIKDISDKVGVSTALVSYVLNGHEKKMRVSALIAQKIRDTAEELNYKPNQIARSLRRGNTKTIGLIVADIANHFFAQLARIIENAAVKKGYTVIFGSADEDEYKSDTLINTFLDRQVDGFIIVPSEGTRDQIAYLVKSGVPIVLIDRYFPDLNTCYVCLDNFQASFDATRHLINQGCKNITMVAYESTLIHMADRIRGYKEAMLSDNLNGDSGVIELPYSYSKKESELYIEETIKDFSNLHALIFATNSLTLAGINCLNKLGIKIPDQIKIVGFDGGDAFDYFYSPLTFIEQPLLELGTQSVNILISLMEGVNEIIQLNLKPILNVRNSTM